MHSSKSLRVALFACSSLPLAVPAGAQDLALESADGNLSVKFGLRLQYDFNVIGGNERAGEDESNSDSYFRRAEITFGGTAYGWRYTITEDFAGDDAPTAKDVSIAHDLGPGAVVIGQFKSYRTMETLTSSGATLFTERAYVQSNFPGHEYAMGVGYNVMSASWTYAAALQNRKSLEDDSGANEDYVASARLTFAPVNEDRRTLHLGASLSLDDLNGGRSDDSNVQYAGRTLGSVALVQDFEQGRFVGLEAAAKLGAWHAQAEAMQGVFDLVAGGTQDAVAYYVQTGWLVTGESRPYSKGVFQYAKPNNAEGAVELKARYDYAENEDLPKAEVSAWLVGANWYLNPAVTFMLEYIAADAGAGFDGADEPKVFAGRLQLSF